VTHNCSFCFLYRYSFRNRLIYFINRLIYVQDLQNKIDVLNNTVSLNDQLQSEYSELRHTLVEKDETIHNLEISLAEEREKVVVGLRMCS